MAITARCAERPGAPCCHGRVHHAVSWLADLARQPIGTRGEAARACDLWSGEAVAARPGPSADSWYTVPAQPRTASASLRLPDGIPSRHKGSVQTLNTMVYCSIVGPYPF